MSQHSAIFPCLPVPAPGEIAARQAAISEQFLREARGARVPNFSRIATGDLPLLFGLYDQMYLGQTVATTLHANRIRLSFRLAPRCTHAGGKTTLFQRRADGLIPVEIAISTTLLFESFREEQARHIVAGCICCTRLDALLRVFEHELLHLFEFNDYGRSSCARRPFRTWAQRLFGHRASNHQLLRPADRARTDQGIRVGSRVAFELEGRRLAGVVNRITKRATVLVPCPHGSRYSDGRTYAKYYVPLGQLRAVS